MKALKVLGRSVAALFAYVGAQIVTPALAATDTSTVPPAAEARARAELAYRLNTPATKLLPRMQLSPEQRLQIEDISTTLSRALPQASQGELSLAVIQAMQSQVFAEMSDSAEMRAHRFGGAVLVSLQFFTVMEEAQMLRYRGEAHPGDDRTAAELENLRLAKIAALQAVYRALATTDDERAAVDRAVGNWLAGSAEDRAQGKVTLADLVRDVVNGRSHPVAVASANATFSPGPLAYAAPDSADNAASKALLKPATERASSSLFLARPDAMIARGVSPRVARIMGGMRGRADRLDEIVRNAVKVHGEAFAQSLLTGIDQALTSAAVNRAYLPDEAIPAAFTAYVAAHITAVETAQLNRADMLARYDNGFHVADRRVADVFRRNKIAFAEMVGKTGGTPTQQALVERAADHLLRNPQTATGAPDIAARAAMLSVVNGYHQAKAETIDARAKEITKARMAVEKARTIKGSYKRKNNAVREAERRLAAAQAQIDKPVAVNLSPTRHFDRVLLHGPKQEKFDKNSGKHVLTISRAEEGHLWWLACAEACGIKKGDLRIGEFTAAASVAARALTNDNAGSLYGVMSNVRSNGLHDYEPLDRRGLGSFSISGESAAQMRAAMKDFNKWYTGVYFRSLPIIEARLREAEARGAHVSNPNRGYNLYTDGARPAIGDSKTDAHTFADGENEGRLDGGRTLTMWWVPTNVEVRFESEFRQPKAERKAVKKAESKIEKKTPPAQKKAERPARPQQVAVNGVAGGARQTSYWKFAVT